MLSWGKQTLWNRQGLTVDHACEHLLNVCECLCEAVPQAADVAVSGREASALQVKASRWSLQTSHGKLATGICVRPKEPQRQAPRIFFRPSVPNGRLMA